MLAWGQLDDELLDERCDVLVADDFALPFLDAHDALGHLDAEVALDFDLAAEAPVVLLLLAAEVADFRGEDFAAALDNRALALSARALSAAGRGEVYAVDGEGVEQRSAALDFHFVVAVDDELDGARGYEVALGDKQDGDQKKNDNEEYDYARKN